MRSALLALALALLAACGGEVQSRTVIAEPTVATAAAAVDFTDAEGRIVCPVMGDAIKNKELAVGHTEHAGKTYWFCCDSCQHMFSDDPEKYADGRFLAHLEAEHGGQFGKCYH